MESKTLLEFMALAEKLKNRTRHCDTTEGRRESVAEHTFRTMVFAWLLKDEFPGIQMERVMEICLFHDFGEAITGDIPSFEKTKEDEATEQGVRNQIVQMLPENRRMELQGIFEEMDQRKTEEAKLFQALDKMEAVISHNEADISTWLPLEYELQLTYGVKEADAFPYTKKLRKELQKQTLDKIERESTKGRTQ